MQHSENLLKAIAVTAELTDTDLSEAAARVMAEDLAMYPEKQVLGALIKCRRELKGRLRINDVIERLDDGRPGPEEAWAMIPRSESDSVVWTREMAEAFGVVYSMIDDGDHVAARMAFIETYKAKCNEARNNSTPVKWEPSLGHDKNGREHVLMDALEKGRLPASQVAKLLPYHDRTSESERLLNDLTARPVTIGDVVKKLALEESVGK